MPNWKKLVTSGSDAYLNSVTVDGPVINDLTASYAITALNTYNSTALNSGTVQRIPTASATWSIQHNLHELWPMVTIWEENPSFVYTMVVPNNIVSINANTVEVTFTEPIRGYVNVSRAGHVVSGSVPWTNLIGPAIITASLDISGSVTATGGFTGSLFGTSSWALNSISSSYSLSSSYAVSSSFAVTASHAVSASFATSASFALNTQDVLIYVKNANTYSIPKGTVVRISGATGDNPLISTASYESDPVSANTLGITNQIIPADSFGYVMTEGTLYGINTNGFTPGQLLYLGPTGSIIGTSPSAPLHNVRLGQVLRVQQNNGSMYVRIDNGYELDELHDVKITSASFGDTIVRSGSVWINSKQLSGSYGITGSLNITGSLQINTSKTNAGSSVLTSGSNNTFINEPLNSYKSLHVKYHVIGASGARAGNIMSIVSGSQVQYIETTTGDIGNTDGLILTVALTNGNQNITVQYNNQSGTNFTFTSEYTLL